MMDYFFRSQDNPYGGDDEAPSTEEVPEDAQGESNYFQGHFSGRDEDDDEEGDDDEENQHGDDDPYTKGSVENSYLNNQMLLPTSFDSGDRDDAAYSDDAYTEEDEKNFIETKRSYFEPQLPSLDTFIPFESSTSPKYEISYQADEADAPAFGVFAIVAVIVWFFLRRCCSCGNTKKKIKSSAKISYNSSPRYRPAMTIV